MSLNLSNTLVVAVSTTALFELTEADNRFQALRSLDPDRAIAEYRAYMLERETEQLLPGTAYPLVKALLELNRFRTEDSTPLVEVVVISRNSPETGLRVLNSIRSHSLPISRSAFTGGEPVVDYLDAFDVSLFLTTNPEDALRVADSRVCATAVVRAPPSGPSQIPEGQVRIAFDGDAVLFDESGEVVYKRDGLTAFHKRETDAEDVPMELGPHGILLKKLARLQERLPVRVEYSPVRISIVTARNSPADVRVIKTLRRWGVYVDEAFFLGGLPKTKFLAAFKPHIFFEDQDVHLKEASSVVPSAQVPYASSSQLRAKEEPPSVPEEASPAPPSLLFQQNPVAT